MGIKSKRRVSEDISISFLDVICCGFGAIVLLLLITKTTAPNQIEKTAVDLDKQVALLRDQLFSLRGETTILNRDLNAKQEQLSLFNEKIARLRGDLSALDSQYQKKRLATNANDTVFGELQVAKQTLSAEMKRLLGERYERKNDVIGGIPVDSEYVIFIVDTSGSMFNYAWPRVQQEMMNVLRIYPKVKGIQVLNDMGDYMFSSYRNQWIPDTPARRQAVMKRLGSWNPFSNSSPVEGIQSAIRTFYNPDKKISLYVFGDDFTGDSIQRVVDTVDRINREATDGQRMVRIHAVGFPVQFLRPRHEQGTLVRFAALMRELAYRNQGSFVGLNDFR
ncbi:MAG: VWA domain-containing protein [Cellvibrionaceae bacterium]